MKTNKFSKLYLEFLHLSLHGKAVHYINTYSHSIEVILS